MSNESKCHCHCIENLIKISKMADDEADSLRKTLLVGDDVGESQAVEKLIAKLEYDASLLNSVIRLLELTHKG